MKHFVILINYNGSGGSPKEAVETKLSAIAPDWMRFGVGQYVIASESEQADDTYLALKPLLHENDYILVLETDLSNRRGWAQPVAVNWVSRHSP